MIGSVDQLRREWNWRRRETGNEAAGPVAFDGKSVSLKPFPHYFGGLLKDGSCFKRKKLHKLFTKKSRKLERTLTS